MLHKPSIQSAKELISFVLMEPHAENASSSAWVIYLYWCNLVDYQYWPDFFFFHVNNVITLQSGKYVNAMI